MHTLWEDWLSVARYWILKDTSSCVTWSHTLHSPHTHQQNITERVSISIPIWERKLRHGKAKQLMKAHSCSCSYSTPVLQTLPSQPARVLMHLYFEDASAGWIMGNQGPTPALVSEGNIFSPFCPVSEFFESPPIFRVGGSAK